MVSTVTDWIDVPYTEAEIGDNYYGMTGKVGMAIRAALDQVAHTINWSEFDADNDGEIDAIAIIHSGFGAEAAEPDCYSGLAPEGRIWSHKWNLDQDWTAPGTGTLVWKYHISPALWGSCGSNIGRIGVICHETGHFLGCPDIYDGTGGNGTYKKRHTYLIIVVWHVWRYVWYHNYHHFLHVALQLTLSFSSPTNRIIAPPRRRFLGNDG